MKHLLTLIVALWTATAFSASSDIPQAFKFRYMHWNIGHYANGNDYKSHITADDHDQKKMAYHQLFAKYQADIVGICEWSEIFYADENASETLLSQYAHHYIAPTQRGYIGVALHSIFPLVQLQEITLTRGYTAYEGVFYIGGKKVIVCECHLPWQSAELHDEAQAMLLERYKDEERVLVAGDFNFYERDREKCYQLWQDYGYETANCGYQGNIVTAYNLVTCSFYLDNIFVKGGKIMHVEVEKVVPEGYEAPLPNAGRDEKERLAWEACNLSDHFPLIADIVFEY